MLLVLIQAIATTNTIVVNLGIVIFVTLTVVAITAVVRKMLLQSTSAFFNSLLLLYGALIGFLVVFRCRQFISNTAIAIVLMSPFCKVATMSDVVALTKIDNCCC